MSFGMFGSIFLLAQFFQTAQGYSPLQSGLRILPWTAMPMIVAPIAGALSDRIGGRRIMGTGLALQALGLAWIAAATTRAASRTSTSSLPFTLSGIGHGRSSSPRSRTSCSRRCGRSEEGQASGANSAIRELGGVFGVAVLASVFAHYGSYESPQTFSDGMVPAVWIGAAVVAGRLGRRVRDQAQPPRGGGRGGRRARAGRVGRAPRSDTAARHAARSSDRRSPPWVGAPSRRPRGRGYRRAARVCMPFGRILTPRACAAILRRRENGAWRGTREQRLLVLGAGPEQLGLLEAARAHGIWTAVCDRDPSAPGFRARRPPLHRLDRGRADDRAARRGARPRRRDRALLRPRRRAVAARIAERLGLAASGLARDRGGRRPQAPPARAARRGGRAAAALGGRRRRARRARAAVRRQGARAARRRGPPARARRRRPAGRDRGGARAVAQRRPCSSRSSSTGPEVAVSALLGGRRARSRSP